MVLGYGIVKVRTISGQARVGGEEMKDRWDGVWIEISVWVFEGVMLFCSPGGSRQCPS